MQVANHVLLALLRSFNTGSDRFGEMAAVLQGTQQGKGVRLERLAIDSRPLPVNGQIHGTCTRDTEPSRSLAPLQARTGSRLGLINAHQELIDWIAELQQPQMRLQFECWILTRTRTKACQVKACQVKACQVKACQVKDCQVGCRQSW